MNVEIKNFLDVVADKSGGNTKIPQANFQKTGQYPIIDQGKEFIAGYTDDETALLKSTSLPVIIFGDHTKIIKYADFPFALGADGVKVLKPSAEAHPKYIYHFLKSVHILDAGYSRHFKFLKETKIPLPSLPTQTHIAHLLDKADELRQKRQTAIKKLDDLLQANFIKMFGDPVVNPMGWDKSTLKDISQVFTGKTPPSKKENMFHGEIPFITPSDLGGYIYTNSRTITQEGAKFSKVIPKHSTLVCCIGATIGKMGFIIKDSAFNQQINSITWNSRVEPLFGFYMMKFFSKKITFRSQSTTLPILNKSEFEKITVIMPPLSLQTQFAHIATHIETQKAKLQAQADELEGLFLSLQQRAFDGRLTNFTP